jgi:hypothetical protein
MHFLHNGTVAIKSILGYHSREVSGIERLFAEGALVSSMKEIMKSSMDEDPRLYLPSDAVIAARLVLSIS